MVPIIITARKQSQRCPLKLFREFARIDGESLSLLDICLSKFKNDPNVYLAGYEPDFKDLAEKHNINFIQRSKESAFSEDPKIIHSYLHDYNFENICLLNPCCPFATAKKIYEAISIFKMFDYKSLFSVKITHDLIFNQDKELINKDRVFNSKIRKSNYIGNNVIVMFSPRFFFENNTYWTYEKNDPYLYQMPELESFDIDTELDFLIGQTLYQSLYQKQA